MIDPALQAALAAFDDEALATLANAGLVRRAHRDVAEEKVRLVGGDPAGATVDADGQQVVIGVRGPAAASCACRSVTLCRHRLAATIFLRDMAASTEADEPPVAEADADLLAAFDLAALERWAGKAGWRAALELAGSAGEIAVGEQAATVAFPDVEGPVRILRGQGPDGIVSRASKARRKAVHAAAVLAAMRHRGMSVPDPTVEPEDDAPAVEIDGAFLDRVRSTLGEVAALGFNLAPLPLEEALFELSVSSRADSLPRLAAMLRGIAAQMRLRRARALDFDPDRMLELTATSLALVSALGRADPDRRASLAGKVRRDYTESDRLELVGCGGERWTSASGARGVTAWFLEPASGTWLSASIARGPGQDPAFRPGEAWRQQAMWQAAPMAELAHARFTLDGARRSADSRLSAPAAARASVIERGVVPDPGWPGVVHDWTDLQARWIEQTGVGIDHAEQAAACLIAPTDTAPFFFDELAQHLVWPVRDRRGRWLALTVAHEEWGSTVIEALEATVRSGWRGLALVRIEREGERLAVRPLTLFGPGEPVDLSLWVRPWRAKETASPVRDWLDRLRARAGRAFATAPRSTTDAAVAAAWRHLLDRLEVGPVLAGSLDGELATVAERIDRIGLSRLAALLRSANGADALLTAAYALLLVRQQRCAPPLLA